LLALTLFLDKKIKIRAIMAGFAAHYPTFLTKNSDYLWCQYGFFGATMLA
jgi:hypothetical protein